jgi:hypothetical protein
MTRDYFTFTKSSYYTRIVFLLGKISEQDKQPQLYAVGRNIYFLTIIFVIISLSKTVTNPNCIIRFGSFCAVVTTFSLRYTSNALTMQDREIIAASLEPFKANTFAPLA